MIKYETFANEQELKDRIETLKNRNSGELKYDITNTLEDRSFVLSYDWNVGFDDEVVDGLKDQDKNDTAQNDRPAGYSTKFIK